MKALALGLTFDGALRAAGTLNEADAALVDRHRAGDPAAFEELYERYFGLVHHLGLRFLGDREEAADVAQDVFFRVHRHLATFRGGSSLKTWIYRIAINRCRSAWVRRRWREGLMRSFGEATAGSRGESAGAEPFEPVDPSRGPEDLALAGDTARRVAAALLRVPSIFRAALVLRDLDGLSYDEISAALAVPVGTVRSRIARGREALRGVLEEEEEEEES